MGTMAQAQIIRLENRGVLKLGGADLRSFLQGIVSNDVTKVSPERAIWCAFLTPQGKFLHEFFLAQVPGSAEETFLLDCERDRRADLKKRLSIYRLRSKVTIEDADPDYQVAAVIGPGALAGLGLGPEPGSAQAREGGIVFTDPRLSALGARSILPREAAPAEFGEGSQADYDRLRISLGVPDGSRDMEVDKSILLECGFSELNGVDWDKGCFMGQELTARTKYRGLIKKRLLPIRFEGTAPEPGTAVLSDGKEVGIVRSVADGRGLALLRLDRLQKAADLVAGSAKVTPEMPDWIKVQ